jgi:tetratricopeptide (TPR) repeat protein
MSLTRRLAIGLAAVLLQTARPFAAQQRILVLCAADKCDFRAVAMFQVGGRQSIRLASAPAEKASAADLKAGREVRLDQIAGLYRDGASGVFYALGTDGKPRELAVPVKSGGKEGVTPASAWRGEMLEYSDAPNAKTKSAAGVESFAYLLVSADAEQAVFQLLQRLLEPGAADPRRPALIRGALDFTAKSPALQQWRDQLLGRMRADLKRFDEQEGDPATLADALGDALQVRSIYLQIGDEKQNKPLLDSVVAADDLFRRRVAVAEVFRKASFWDEYWLKLKQLGLAKWSVPNVLQNARDALGQISQLHQERARRYKADGHLDRAFDEAELAARNSCQVAVNEDFYQASVTLVNHNKIAAAVEYTGPEKAMLEQVVRELDQLDPNREQVTIDRVRRGERLDPNYLPLQLKKAEFLDKLGRYSEALEVVRRIERRIPLDGRQLDDFLRLDGRITNNLSDAIQKSQEETRKQLEGQRYEAALEASAKGLKADPLNVPLLYQSALASAFLRRNADAIRFIRTYLSDANLACAPAGEPEKMLDLYRLLAVKLEARPVRDGIPNWISGMRYRPGDVFYDPISLGFLQPVQRISSEDGVATLFTREDRSFLVKSIATTIGNRKASAGPQSAPTETFEAEPKYDRQALSMLEIGSRATSAGERTAHALTYLNSPGVDPDLVFRFTGRQIARGWSGNPFFHPFIWSGFYVFDLSYDRLGRVATATPIREEAGSRTDPFSEPLQFTWDGDSTKLMSIKGTRSGYLREMVYGGDGRLESERITYPKGKGTITYEYLPASNQLRSAKAEDNFYDKRERIALFDTTVNLK